MITAAHVGVGIRGVEGQQAARASDYAIGEFKFLRRLLLVHGTESYRKNSVLILYNFYKNMVLVFPQFWAGFFTFFSGIIIYDSYLYQFFNMLFAAMPIIVYAVYDQETSEQELYTTPRFYNRGLERKVLKKSGGGKRGEFGKNRQQIPQREAVPMDNERVCQCPGDVRGYLLVDEHKLREGQRGDHQLFERGEHGLHGCRHHHEHQDHDRLHFLQPAALCEHPRLRPRLLPHLLPHLRVPPRPAHRGHFLGGPATALLLFVADPHHFLYFRNRCGLLPKTE